MSDLDMKQSDHPAHDMPEPTDPHNGDTLPTGRGAAYIGDMVKRNTNSSPMNEPMVTSPRGEQ